MPNVRKTGGLNTFVVDMSLPADQRRRKKKKNGRKGKGKVAQMDHGNSPEGNDMRRNYERQHGR